MQCARAIRWRMRSSAAKCNQIPPLRTVQRAKFCETLAVECGAARFWFIEFATVHRCGTGNTARNPFCGKADVQQCCTSAFDVKTGEVR
jgi:hypothetical protein